MVWGNWFGRPSSLSVQNNAGGSKPVGAPVKRERRRQGKGGGGLKTSAGEYPAPRPAFPFRPVTALSTGMPLKFLSAAVAKFVAQVSSATNALVDDMGDHVRGWSAGVAQQWRRDVDALQDVCRTFAVRNVTELQDLLNSLVLAECVYKAVDSGPEEGAAQMAVMLQQFPRGLTSLRSVQWALPHVHHRYLIAESDGAMYVAFMGTKQRRDMFTNANVLQEVVWDDLEEVPSHEVHQGAPAAHRGFLRRARAVPIESLYLHAHRKGKRLVLCGHSLGGAVATLCTVRLLQHLPPPQRHYVRCFGFATPPVGNSALSSLVQQAGWDAHISNFMLPEDVIPRLLTFARHINHHATVAFRPEEDAQATAAAGGAALSESSASAAAATSRARSLLPVASVAVSSPTASAAAAHDRPRLPFAFWHRSTGGGPVAAASSATGAGGGVGSKNQQQGATELPLQQPQQPPQQRQAGKQHRQQANNILAASASQMQRLRHLSSSMREQDAASATTGSAAAGVSAAPSTATTTTTEVPPPSSTDAPTTHSSSASSPSAEPDAPSPLSGIGSAGGQWHARVARTASRGVSKAAHIVATPVRAARAYVPVGRQLYVLPHNVSRTPPHAAAAAGSSDSTGVHRGVGAVPPLALAAAQEQQAAEEAAAAAAAGGGDAAPQEQQRRKRALFHMHRMASYRGRVLAILCDALESSLRAQGGGGGTMVHSSGRRPAGVVLSDCVAPRLRPYSATGFLASAPLDGASSSSSGGGGAKSGSIRGGSSQQQQPPPQRLIPLVGGAAAKLSPSGRWTWPWAQFFFRGGEGGSGAAGPPGAATAAPPVEVLLRITGLGLENCSRVDLSAGGSGGGEVVRADVVAKPVAPLPLQLNRGYLQQLAGPVQEAWHVAKAWAGQDPLLVRVSIPQQLLQEWAADGRAASAEGRRAAGGTQATGGTATSPGQRLAVRLVGDFQVVEIPLKLESLQTTEEQQAAEDRFRQIGHFFATSKL